MCGICGLVSRHSSGVDRDVLGDMNEALLRRGPDSEGMVVDETVGLAMRRLSIIDLEGGDQPIGNEDGSIQVVQNGEIYNYRELRAELERSGHRFATASDTEVLVHLYEERGPHFAEALRGMFAIAIWDRRARRLVLARDRFGIKPLYYAVTADTISFASELKALIRQPGFSRDLDPDALEAFLAYSCIPAPLTIFRAASKLPAGCLLIWEDNEPQIERFATSRPAGDDELLGGSPEELAGELRERLRDSVKAHLIADVPVGVLLSGGIDSSALAALAATESSGTISTFSIGFDERGYDERSRARLVAQHYGTDHHELVLKPDATELLPQLAGIFDEPFADSSAIPTYLVSQLARRHVKVALSGEGGDELFGGYFNYAAHVLAPRLRYAAAVARPFVERLPSSTSKASSLEYKAKHFVRGAGLPALERHHQWKSIFREDARAEILLHRNGARDPIELLRARFAGSAGADALARIMDVDVAVFLVEDMLTKTDRASMANSLEARVPFLDTVVADFAWKLPRRMKVRGLSKKWLLRRAVAPLLPEAIVKGKKQGFSIPVGPWLRGEMEPFARDVLAAERIRRQGVFEPDAITRLIDQHVDGSRDNSRQLWAMLVFSLWHDRYAGAG